MREKRAHRPAQALFAFFLFISSGSTSPYRMAHLGVRRLLELLRMFWT